MYKILYGTEDVRIDVTDIVFQKCVTQNTRGELVAFIPEQDAVRASIFTDPILGQLKTVFIYKDDELRKEVGHQDVYEIPIEDVLQSPYGNACYNMGRHSYGQPHVLFSNFANLSIGNFSQVAGNVRIYLGGNHRVDWISTYPFGYINKDVFKHHGEGHPSTKGDVIIGNDVWIGNDTTIMSGVKIGDGAVVAANSHVVKDIEPYAIVGGNPSRLIRYRFTPTQIEKLLEIKWWDWDDEKINNNIHLISSPNIEDFLASVSSD